MQDHDVVRRASINHKIGLNNSDTDIATETRPRASGTWMRNQALEGSAELIRIVVCNAAASPLIKTLQDITNVIDRLRRIDESRHGLAFERLANARPSLIGGYAFTPVHGSDSFIDQGLGPFEIIVDRGHKVGNRNGYGLVQ